VRSKLVRSAKGDVLVCTKMREDSPKARALRRAGVEILRIAGRGAKPDLRAVVAELGRREILSVLLEAGGTLNSAALAAGIVDKLRLFIAPKIAGFAGVRVASIGLRAAHILEAVTMTPVGPDFAVEGYLHNVYGNR
jgi:diaminohydroxyphosphoribosylaminopyrimidine deaminase/5-amino-6-(5-phosphoribosylamino)uracil reductase